MGYNEAHYLKQVPGFPGYSVSKFGRFFNDETAHEMTLSGNQKGELTVGLMREGVQVRRSAKLLVAKAWVRGESEIHNTPMLLDGNHQNLNAENIVWRPRWFAWKYSRQWDSPRDFFGQGPVLEMTTNARYHNVAHAALENGELCVDIIMSILNELYVFPHNHKYAWAQRS